MLNKLIQTTAVMTSVLILSACNFDQSFSTEGSVPAYTPSTTQAVTTNRAPVVSTTQTTGSRSMVSPFRDGSYDNRNNVVTTTTTSTQQPTVTLSPDRAPGPEGYRPAPVAPAVVEPTSNVIPVTASSTRVQPVAVAAPEPAVRSTPDDVIVTH
jgi:hypothetical protein